MKGDPLVQEIYLGSWPIAEDVMKAMVLRELGGKLQLEEVAGPKIGPNDALLRVRATGVGLTVVIMTACPGA